MCSCLDLQKFLFQNPCPISGPDMFVKQWQKKKKNTNHSCKATLFQMNIKPHESWSLLHQTRSETLYLQTMQHSFKGAAEEIVLSWNQGNYYIFWGFDLGWIYLCNWTEGRKTMMEGSLVEKRAEKDHPLFTNIGKTGL